METIWVLENVKNSFSFYSKLELWMLTASICLWKKHHPNHTTVIYCDQMTHGVLEKLDLLQLWDEVRSLTYPDKINREIFWSSCKSKIISETQISILVVDHDFLVFKNLDQYLKQDVVCTYDEIASNWYPRENNVHNRALTTPIKYYNNYASNVSLFYLPDPQFAREYGLQTIKNHSELSQMDIKDLSANYMILSEQLMLRQWVQERQLPYTVLYKNVWDCQKGMYTPEEIDYGLFGIKEIGTYMKHYGIDKARIKEDRNGFSYHGTIEFLQRCVKSSKLIDINYLKNTFSYIQNI